MWLGQLISVSGSRMQMAAILWHVSLLAPEGQKALALGLVGLVRIVPIIVFSLISGVVADTLPRRRLMVITQSGMALIASLLAVITLRGLTALWPLYLLTGLGAAVRSFDSPARQALIPNLVPREHLSNAISLGTIMFQTASVVGPALAGVIIASLGVGWAYVYNTLSFSTVISALLLMRDVPDHTGDTVSLARPRAALEGLRFVFSSPLIRSTMLLDFFATFFSSATALLPIFAQDVLNVGATGYGWLSAAPSVGAMLASAGMVRLADRIERRGWVLLWSIMGYGAATVAFGLSRNFWLTFACLGLVGATDTVSMVLRNIIRQLATPDRLRGRMVSVNMIFYMGGPQLGELEAGLAANWLGAPLAVVLGGFGCLLVTAWVTLKNPALRRYRREGASFAIQQAIAD
jgi:MFS family permease